MLNRRIAAIALGVAAVAVMGACLAPVLLPPPVVQCTRLSTPVQFIQIDSRQVRSGRSTRQFPMVEYSYVVAGTRYTSTRLFCTAKDDVVVDWSRVDRFFHDARNGAEVVAWFMPSSPESACISIHSEFGYSLVSDTSSQCRGV